MKMMCVVRYACQMELLLSRTIHRRFWSSHCSSAISVVVGFVARNVAAPRVQVAVVARVSGSIAENLQVVKS